MIEMGRLYEQIISRTLSKSFAWIFTLTFLLYFFSVRFPLYLYPLPIVTFLIYFNFSPGSQLSVKAIILYFFISVFVLMLIISGLYNLNFNIQIKTALYLIFFLVPLTYIFYSEANKHPISRTFSNILYSYLILSTVIFLLYQYGFIAANRYQHVGNILAASSILILGINNKKLKWTLFFIWLFFILIVGSRQALAGLVFSGLIFFVFNNFKTTLVFLITCITLYLNSDFILNKISELAYQYEFTTLIRIIYSINTGGGNSFNTRIEIYTNLINEVNFFPNLGFIPNNDMLLPHNFFLEYFIVCGYFFGLLFMIIIFIIIYNSVFSKKHQVLVYFSLFYFVTFNVSTGIGASKYFLYYCFLLIVLNQKKHDYLNG